MNSADCPNPVEMLGRWQFEWPEGFHVGVKECFLVPQIDVIAFQDGRAKG
jgi:hypothetical protein